MVDVNIKGKEKENENSEWKDIMRGTHERVRRIWEGVGREL